MKNPNEIVKTMLTDDIREGDVFIVEDGGEIEVLGICGRVFILSSASHPDDIRSFVTNKNLEESINRGGWKIRQHASG